MCRCVYVCIYPHQDMCMWRLEALDHLELELQIVMSHLAWVQGIEFRSSGCVLSYWAISSLCIPLLVVRDIQELDFFVAKAQDGQDGRTATDCQPGQALKVCLELKHFSFYKLRDKFKTFFSSKKWNKPIKKPKINSEWLIFYWVQTVPSASTSTKGSMSPSILLLQTTGDFESHSAGRRPIWWCGFYPH